jgi:hypothetical protein
MKNIFTFGNFKNQLNEALPLTPAKDIKKMSPLELYDYFYNKVKQDPDSIIKQLEKRIKNPSPIDTAEIKVDLNMLSVFAQSVKEGNPLGKDTKEKQYMGERFKKSLSIIEGLTGLGSIKVSPK